MEFLNQYLDSIKSLCASHNVKQLFAFGSVLTLEFKNDSDIDLLVDFKTIDTIDYADNYYDLKFSLEQLLQRPIDLLEDTAIKNPYLREVINKKRRLVYGC